MWRWGSPALLALAALAFIVMLFGEMPSLVTSGYAVYVDYPFTGGVSKGAEVRFNGIIIGRVAGIAFQTDPSKGVTFDCRINNDMRLPGNCNAYIFTRGFAGAAFVEFRADGQPPGGLRTEKFLATDGSAPSRASWRNRASYRRRCSRGWTS